MRSGSAAASTRATTSASRDPKIALSRHWRFFSGALLLLNHAAQTAATTTPPFNKSLLLAITTRWSNSDQRCDHWLRKTIKAWSNQFIVAAGNHRTHRLFWSFFSFTDQEDRIFCLL